MSDLLTEVTTRLADILEQENTALAALDLAAATALLAAKQDALAALETARRQPRSAPPPGFATAAERLAGLAAENRAALQRAMAAQSRVLSLVMHAASRALPPAPRYGAQGMPEGGARPPLAISARA